MVIFQGDFHHVYETAVDALGAALALHFDDVFRVLQAYTFWGGDFCLIRVERVGLLGSGGSVPSERGLYFERR